MLGKKSFPLADYLFGEKAKLSYLLFGSAILILIFLGAKDLWTHENRWSGIVLEMFINQDYFNPYLQEDVAYYDKPLLSYWLILLAIKLFGGLSNFALRLPAALSGIFAVWCTYRLAYLLTDNRKIAFLSGWMLTTTACFVFWARTGTADMMTLAGTVAATLWFYQHKEKTSFFAYFVFFLIMTITSSCKGLLGFVLPSLAVLPALIQDGLYKRHLSKKFFLAASLGVTPFFIPFLFANHVYDGASVTALGFERLFMENIMRFIKPWDHKGPIYLYFYILPLYLMPWAVFIPFAGVHYWQNRRTLTSSQKELLAALAILFVFFTLSRGRRDYYILPVLPFAIILIAIWLEARAFENKTYLSKISSMAAGTAAILFAYFGVVQPLLYSGGGSREFSVRVRQAAEELAPWSSWEVYLLDPRRRLAYYMQPASSPHYCHLNSHKNETMPGDEIIAACDYHGPFGNKQVVITRELYTTNKLDKYFSPSEYTIIKTKPTIAEKLFGQDSYNPVAYIPKQFFDLG